MGTVVVHKTYFPRVPVFMAGPFFFLYMTYFKIAESKLKIFQAGDPVIGKPAYSLRHEMMCTKIFYSYGC